MEWSNVEIESWGGSGGEPWNFEPQGGGITKIIIGSGDIIDSVQFVGRTVDGNDLPSPKWGGDGGRKDEIILDWPNEYITLISGTQGVYFGNQIIKGLEFHTNSGKIYGPYGYGKVLETDTPFSLKVNHGAVVGFHGRSGYFVDAIGVYLR